MSAKCVCGHDKKEHGTVKNPHDSWCFTIIKGSMDKYCECLKYRLKPSKKKGGK